MTAVGVAPVVTGARSASPRSSVAPAGDFAQVLQRVAAQDREPVRTPARPAGSGAQTAEQRALVHASDKALARSAEKAHKLGATKATAAEPDADDVVRSEPTDTTQETDPAVLDATPVDAPATDPNPTAAPVPSADATPADGTPAPTGPAATVGPAMPPAGSDTAAAAATAATPVGTTTPTPALASATGPVAPLNGPSAPAAPAPAASAPLTPAAPSGARPADSAQPAPLATPAVAPADAQAAAAPPAPAPVADAIPATPAPTVPSGAVAAPQAPAPTQAPAPAQAPTTPNPPTPPPLAEQLGARLTALTGPGGLSHGRHVLTVPVDPEHLGPVRIVAHISATSVRVELVGSTDASREALKGVLADLRKDLAASGLTVDVGSDSRPDPRQSNAGADLSGSSGGGRPRDGGAQAPAAASVVDTPTTPIPARTPGDRSLDLVL